jgi:hypothetical protein
MRRQRCRLIPFKGDSRRYLDYAHNFVIFWELWISYRISYLDTANRYYSSLRRRLCFWDLAFSLGTLSHSVLISLRPLTIVLSKMPNHIFSLEVVRIPMSNAQEITPMIVGGVRYCIYGGPCLFRSRVHSHLVKAASPTSSATLSVNVIALFTIAPRSNRNSRLRATRQEKGILSGGRYDSGR